MLAGPGPPAPPHTGCVPRHLLASGCRGSASHVYAAGTVAAGGWGWVGAAGWEGSPTKASSESDSGEVWGLPGEVRSRKNQRFGNQKTC